MGLTSNKVLVLSILFTALLFAGTVWCWPVLAPRTWRAVSGRIGLLFATQLALFASVGLGANQAFGFYAGWADLFGQESGQGVVVDGTGGAPGRGPLQVLDTQHVTASGGGRARTGGQIQKVAVVGRTTHIAAPAYVYLPPEYFQPRYRERRFPAAVVLTGYPGTAEALIKGLHYPRTARELAKDGRMQPMILVMMRPTVAPPRDTECVDVPGGPRAESFFARDLPDAVLAHYRVSEKPGGWGVIGDSTGGYCALKLAMHHPDVYAAGVGLSPSFKASLDATTGDLFRGDTALRDRADLWWCLKHLKAPDTSLLVSSSRVGERNYKDTLEFVDRVKAKGRTRIAAIILDRGGHNFNTWRREIPPALRWMSGRLGNY
ncbi:esterase [Actinobacteria bacterium OK074]|nr:esterase [Actinobacteria bacterium OK074]